MKLLYFAIVLFCSILGCKQEPIKTIGIDSIIIYSRSKDFKNPTIIKDSFTVKKIIKVLKNPKKEPVKFISTYKLDLYYKNNEIKSLLVYRNIINDKGITFILDEDLEVIIEKLIDKNNQ